MRAPHAAQTVFWAARFLICDCRTFERLATQLGQFDAALGRARDSYSDLSNQLGAFHGITLNQRVPLGQVPSLPPLPRASLLNADQLAPLKGSDGRARSGSNRRRRSSVSFPSQTSQFALQRQALPSSGAPPLEPQTQLSSAIVSLQGRWIDVARRVAGLLPKQQEAMRTLGQTMADIARVKGGRELKVRLSCLDCSRNAIDSRLSVS